MNNVVQLPTAASKPVRQCPSRTRASDWRALIQFPVERARSPFGEQVLSDARAMLEADKAATMQIALAVFSVLSDKDRLKVMGRLSGLALRNHAGALSALAWVGYEMSTPDRRRELFAAADWLQERGHI
jgi:hypothetical protein